MGRSRLALILLLCLGLALPAAARPPDGLEVQTMVAFPEGAGGVAETHAGRAEWVWTANFKAFTAFPRRLGRTPAHRWVAATSLGDGDEASTDVGDLVNANGEINGEPVVLAG